MFVVAEILISTISGLIEAANSRFGIGISIFGEAG
jgi:hypothetical protein